MLQAIMEDTEAALQFYEAKGDTSKVRILTEGVLYYIQNYLSNNVSGSASG